MPSWFDMRNYEPSAELNYVGWYRQLSGRLKIPACVQESLYFGEASTPGQLEASQAFLRLLIGNPLPNEHEIEQFLGAIEYLSLESIAPSSIREMTNGDLSLLESEITFRDRLRLREYTDRTSPAKVLNAPTELLDRRVKVPARLGYTPVIVDMEAPRDLLLKEFERFLKAHRNLKCKAGMPSSRFGLLERWVEIGLLPYIDLELWARSDGEKPTYLAISDAFYGDRSHDAQIRGEVARLAIDLLDQSPRGQAVMGMLRQRAAVELRGGEQGQKSTAAR